MSLLYVSSPEYTERFFAQGNTDWIQRTLKNLFAKHYNFRGIVPVSTITGVQRDVYVNNPQEIGEMNNEVVAVLFQKYSADLQLERLALSLDKAAVDTWQPYLGLRQHPEIKLAENNVRYTRGWTHIGY